MRSIVYLALVGALLLPGCKQALFPTLDAIESVVATDLGKGATIDQIENDVCAQVFSSTLADAACGDVTNLVTDALEMLISTGSISGPALENGKAMLAKLKAQRGEK